MSASREFPLHVCHVVLRLDVGGLERVVLDLVREAGRDGHTASVLCLEQPGVLAETAAALGARVVAVGKRPGLRPGVVPRIRRALRELGPDVVHTHQVGALLYAGPAARRLGIPVVHTEHGKHYAGRLRTRLVGRLAARSARRVFAVSADILRELRDCRIAPPGKLRQVPNGVNTERFEVGDDVATLRREFGLPGDGPVVGTVGRLSPIKRQDVLLRALARLRYPTARLLVVGDGPAREELVSLAAGLGITERVVFAGYRDRPERALAAIDLFALTSDSEGMPLAILEAWAAGKPVVATRVGGVPELVTDGRTGLLAPAGDDAALAGCLNRLLVEPALAAELGAAGRALVREHFDTRAMAAAYLRHYRELVRPAVACSPSPRRRRGGRGERFFGTRGVRPLPPSPPLRSGDGGADPGLAGGTETTTGDFAYAHPGPDQPVPEPVAAAPGPVQPAPVPAARGAAPGPGHLADRVDR